jgi:alcohol dehydrogenase class IV
MEMPIDLAPFTFCANARVSFGAGKFRSLPDVISSYGDRVLLVRGSSSLEASGKLDELQDLLDAKDITLYESVVEGEPSPEGVDAVCDEFRSANVHAVLAIGGGSVIDAGKAISAMIPQRDGVENYLEGVGKKKHNGVKVPFIAVPTTAGTGSEATKNAVLSKVGKNGYKRSLRHDDLVPDSVTIDPELALTCPEGVTIACGMDAFTQLLESYVSVKSNAWTDALCEKGIVLVSRGFESVCRDGSDLAARSAMALAAYFSGVSLANAGLGSVHGVASVAGGLFPIPHGVVCGTLLAEAAKFNVEALRTAKDKGKLGKFANAGRLLSGNRSLSDEAAADTLLATLFRWTEDFGIPRLSDFGVKLTDLSGIAATTDVKQNPVPMNAAQVEALLRSRL